LMIVAGERGVHIAQIIDTGMGKYVVPNANFVVQACNAHAANVARIAELELSEARHVEISAKLQDGAIETNRRIAELENSLREIVTASNGRLYSGHAVQRIARAALKEDYTE